MVILVFSFFRSLKAIAASLLLIVIAIVSGYGFVRFLGIPDTPLLLLIPVFSLGLLSDYLIHYFHHRLHPPVTTGKTSLRKLLLFPLSLTALSTLIGFLSLSVIKGSGHLQLGLIIATGVVVTWFGVFYWLDFAQYRSSAKYILAKFPDSQGRMFRRIVKYRYPIFALIIAATVWGALQLDNLPIEPYPIEQLPEDTTIKKSRPDHQRGVLRNRSFFHRNRYRGKKRYSQKRCTAGTGSHPWPVSREQHGIRLFDVDGAQTYEFLFHGRRGITPRQYGVRRFLRCSH